MSKMKLLAILLFVLSLCGCENSETTTAVTSDRLVFYNMTLNNEGEYVANESPMFTIEDVESYDWKNHVILFRKDVLEKMNTESRSFSNKVGGIKKLMTGPMDMFAIYIDDELIYEGYYGQTTISSNTVTGNVMEEVPNGVQMSYYYSSDEKDLRLDTRIYELLEEKNLIKPN